MKFYKAGEIPEVPNMYFVYGDGGTGKTSLFKQFKWRKSSAKHTNEYLLDQLNKYLVYCQQNNSWYHPMNGSTWFNGRFDDVLITENVSNKPKKRIYD